MRVEPVTVRSVCLTHEVFHGTSDPTTIMPVIAEAVAEAIADWGDHWPLTIRIEREQHQSIDETDGEVRVTEEDPVFTVWVHKQINGFAAP